MGYRPDSQSIEAPLTKITEGIEEFREAIAERNKDGDWKQEHLDELEEVYLELRKLSRTLDRLKAQHW